MKTILILILILITFIFITWNAIDINSQDQEIEELREQIEISNTPIICNSLIATTTDKITRKP